MIYVKSLSFVLAILFTTACAAPSNRTQKESGTGVKPVYNYIPKTVALSSPPLDTKRSVYVGDQIIALNHKSYVDAIKISQVAIGTTGWAIKNGVAQKIGEDTNYEWYKQMDNAPIAHINYGSDQNPLPSHSIMIRLKDNAICLSSGVSAYCEKEAAYTKFKETIHSKNKFQRTLIYLGSPEKNRIRLGYREFSSDMARPAFSNDVEYNLARERTIIYKGAVIDIIDATPSKLTYIVKKNFHAEE